MNTRIRFERVACDLCGSGRSKAIFRMPDLRFKIFEPEYCAVECLECSHRFLSPRPSIDTIANVYPDHYYDGREYGNSRQRERYKKQTDYIYKMGPGKILDIGCAGGGWLRTIKGLGWECYGTDLIRKAHKEPEGDIHIKYGYLPELDYSPFFFDVVTAWGVMEHVHEPSRYFECIHSILKREGIFIFMVPNGDSLWSRYSYKEDIPRHLHFFRKKIIRHYARKYKFHVNSIECTNKMYSKPATGKGMFRRNILRKAGVPWENIVFSREKGRLLGLLEKLGDVLDRLLIHPRIEERIGMAGNMVVIFEK